MGNLFNLDNPLWRFMGKLVDVFILTLLWFVCCIPIVTIGPASTAVYYVTLKLVRDEESYTVRSFFKSFKENFKQGAVIGLIMLFLGIFFIWDIYLYFTMGSQIMTIIGILFLGIFMLYLFTLTYVFPLQAKFYNKISRTLKNALFMSVKHIFRSFAMIIIAVVVWVGVLFFPPLLLLSFGLIAFLQSYLLVNIFDKYIPKEENEKDDEFNSDLGIEEEGEQVHIVMTQEDAAYSTDQVLSREMLEKKNEQ
ncbi:MAG: YesL family protein [Lachnospiraceae bacterium]|nr:YesL family protein [Lachnospiraceae bacterium]